MRPRHRALKVGAAALVMALMLAGASPDVAAGVANATCPAPFGTALAAGNITFLGNTSDPDLGLMDTLLMPGAQRSPATVLPFAGRLTLVAEVKVDDPPAFTWGVLVRFFSNETGWGTDPVWVSSADTAVAYPQGFHVRPSPAVWNGSLYVAWTGEGSPAGGPTDRLILMRRVAADGTADPWVVASDTTPARANQHPVLLGAGRALYLAYSAGEGEAEPAATHIAVRTFDGTSFTGSEVITHPPSGWSDELPSLAWDGASGLFAVWTRTNTTGLGATLMFAQRNASGWGEPFEVGRLGQASDANPAVAYFGGQVHVAYSTDDPLETTGPDSDVKLRTFDPQGGTWSPATFVNPQPSGGSDSAPAFSVVAGDLLIGWSTSDDFYAHGSDPDAVYRVLGPQSAGDTVELSAANDTSFDGAPHLFELGGVVYAHFMWTPPVEPGAPRGDSREALRVVSRGPSWFDGLVVSFSFDEVASNGSAHLVVEPAGAVPDGAVLVFAKSDGTRVALDRAGGRFSAWVPVDPSRPVFDVLGCGARLESVSDGPPAPPPPVDLAPYVAVAAVAALAVAAYVVARGRARPPA